MGWRRRLTLTCAWCAAVRSSRREMQAVMGCVGGETVCRQMAGHGNEQLDNRVRAKKRAARTQGRAWTARGESTESAAATEGRLSSGRQGRGLLRADQRARLWHRASLSTGPRSSTASTGCERGFYWPSTASTGCERGFYWLCERGFYWLCEHAFYWL